MANNQRENARKEKKLQKKIKQKRIIWAIIIVVISIIVGLKLTEINYVELGNKIQNTFTHNVEENVDNTITLDSPNKVKMTVVNDKLNVLTDSSYTVYDTSNKSTNYTFIHGYAVPLIRTAGSYTCLYDQGGYRLRLDTNNDNEYEQTLDNRILCADVSNSGTVICATVGDNSKSKITVFSKSLKKYLEYDVSQGYVTRVAIDSSGKRCAFVAVNTKDANLISTVYTININNDKPIMEFELSSANVIDLKYSNTNLYVVCDNGVSIIKNQKTIENVFDNQNLFTVNYSYTKNNKLVYVYSEYIQSVENNVAVITPNGKIKLSFNIDGKVKNVNTFSSDLSILLDDKICTYSLSNGELKSIIDCDSSVNSIVRMGSKIYLQRQQIIESYDC